MADKRHRLWLQCARLALFALPAVGWGAAARAAERPAITRAAVYVAGEVLVGDLDCADVFSEEVVGTVESGLPAVVEVLYELVGPGGKRMRRGLHSIELRYDVWDDVYSLDRGDTVLSFDSFVGMSSAVEHLRGVAVVPLRDLEGEAEYTVAFAIAVHPLRGSEEEEIAGWVDEQVAGSSSRSWRERLLNVNDLIARFFSHDKDTTSRSEWLHTASFRPSRLRHDRGERARHAPLQLAVGDLQRGAWARSDAISGARLTMPRGIWTGPDAISRARAPALPLRARVHEPRDLSMSLAYILGGLR